MSESPAANPFVVKEVTLSTWGDFERLFEAKGSPKACWCMLWRAASPTEWENADSAGRKRAMKARIDAGTPVGLLGYLGPEPVAWCSIAPLATYRRLSKEVEANHIEANNKTWTIACFFVLRPHRRAGIVKRLIAAAVRHAQKHGASAIEAYPVDEDSPSYRFMGFVPVFTEAGFSEIGREGARRHHMRRTLERPAR